LDRALALVGGVWLINLVNFMDGIDWMTVAEIVPWLCSAWRARFCIRNFGCSRALRRDDRFRAVQPARCQIISRQCRQFADRAVVGLAAGDVAGNAHLVATVLFRFLSGGCDHHIGARTHEHRRI
jgi:hypothetical protein